MPSDADYPFTMPAEPPTDAPDALSSQSVGTAEQETKRLEDQIKAMINVTGASKDAAEAFRLMSQATAEFGKVMVATAKATRVPRKLREPPMIYYSGYISAAAFEPEPDPVAKIDAQPKWADERFANLDLEEPETTDADEAERLVKLRGAAEEVAQAFNDGDYFVGARKAPAREPTSAARSPFEAVIQQPTVKPNWDPWGMDVFVPENVVEIVIDRPTVLDATSQSDEFDTYVRGPARWRCTFIDSRVTSLKRKWVIGDIIRLRMPMRDGFVVGDAAIRSITQSWDGPLTVEVVGMGALTWS